MNAKTFFFWSSVAALALVAAYMAIRWLMKREQQVIVETEKQAAKHLADAPRKEIGFHAIRQQDAAAD